ncbi:hypothetical protein NE237_014972 [Protea cynaroides]|uniref:Uncharacterized protein n=1 Tax=Protea cynaroides TaxID=273540 RepID=A0A9Q0KDC4_9MAGN|nr:hypothetical protein NE237_014972 [Protea cynaroides]
MLRQMTGAAFITSFDTMAASVTNFEQEAVEQYILMSAMIKEADQDRTLAIKEKEAKEAEVISIKIKRDSAWAERDKLAAKVDRLKKSIQDEKDRAIQAEEAERVALRLVEDRDDETIFQQLGEVAEAEGLVDGEEPNGYETHRFGHVVQSGSQHSPGSQPSRQCPATLDSQYRVAMSPLGDGRASA